MDDNESKSILSKHLTTNQLPFDSDFSRMHQILNEHLDTCNNFIFLLANPKSGSLNGKRFLHKYASQVYKQNYKQDKVACYVFDVTT